MTGGASKLTLNWIRILIEDFDIDLLICGRTDRRMISALPSDVNFYHLPKLNALQKIFAPSRWASFQEIKNLLAKYKIPLLGTRYDAVVGTSLFWSREACMSYALIQAPRKICFILDEGLLGEVGQKYKVVHKMAVSATTRFVSVSQSLWNQVSTLPLFEGHPQAEIFWPPINPPQEKESRIKLPRDKPVLMTIARLDPIKSIAESLHLHHKLKLSGVNFRWYILGDGPQKANLQKQIKQLNMQDDFLLVGHHDNVWGWLKQADLFVLLSKSEGCPTVILEALHVNLPVLSTNVGGVAELLEGGRLGVIVDQDADNIEASLTTLIQNQSTRVHYQKQIASIKTLNKSLTDKQIFKKILSSKPKLGHEKVTILIPTYNQESFINEAIKSALSQDYKNLSVVVIDDASSDQTALVCAQWLNNPRFTYLKNKENLGRVKNYRDSLLLHAKSEWVLMLDGDDYLTDSSFVSQALGKVESYENLNIAFIQAGHKVVDTRRHKETKILPSIDSEDCLMMPGEYLQFVLKSGFFSHLGMIYRRDLILTHELYNQDISASDMESFLRVSLAHPVIVLNQIAGVWRRHDQNTSCNIDVDLIKENLMMLNPIVLSAKENCLVDSSIQKDLLHYQLSSLRHLFSETLGNSIKTPLAVLKFYQIAWSIHPSFVFYPKSHKMVLKFLLRVFKNLNKKENFESRNLPLH